MTDKLGGSAWPSRLALSSVLVVGAWEQNWKSERGGEIAGGGGGGGEHICSDISLAFGISIQGSRLVHIQEFSRGWISVEPELTHMPLSESGLLCIPQGSIDHWGIPPSSVLKRVISVSVIDQMTPLTGSASFSSAGRRTTS